MSIQLTRSVPDTSGYRVAAGYGVLQRDASTGKPDEITVPVYIKNATGTTDCLHQLTKRLGAGVTMSVSRTRNNNYIQEMGMREFSTATSGLEEVDVSFSGIFTPTLAEWLGYGFMMGDEDTMSKITVTGTSQLTFYTDAACTNSFTSSDSTPIYPAIEGYGGKIVSATSVVYNLIDPAKTTVKFYTDADCTKAVTAKTSDDTNVYIQAMVFKKDETTATITLKTTASDLKYKNAKKASVVYYKDSSGSEAFTPTDADQVVYAKCGNDIFGQPMLYKDGVAYNNFATGSKKVELYGYKNLTGPKYFDIGYQKLNKYASGVEAYDSPYNELGVLVGCIIDSFSLSYESGSDAAMKFQLSVHALRDIEQITTDQFDYSAVIGNPPSEVFVGGCVSVYDPDDDKYVAVAQTDSASFSVGNSIQKLGNCLKLNYSSYAIGALSYDVSTSTYSNDPNKYLKYFYGYSDDMTDTGGQTIGSTAGHYFIGKQPAPIGHMKIRTDDTSAIKVSADIFLDINLTDTYVGDMSNSYDVGSAIMDEPSLRTKKAYIAVGYTG